MTAAPADQSILHYFVRIGVMDDGQVSHGMTYLDWQHAAFSPNGAKTSRYHDIAGGEGCADKASKYGIVIRKLGRGQEALLELALRIQPFDIEGAYAHRDLFIRVFDNLARFIRDINDHFACETCTEENTCAECRTRLRSDLAAPQLRPNPSIRPTA